MIPDRVRYINKRFTNKLMRPLAGKAHTPFAMIHHVGRKSGKPYETIVIVEPMNGKFVFALTYGPKVDWYRNVLNAGMCRMFWQERMYDLVNPVSLEIDTALYAFPVPFNNMLRWIKIEHYFQMDWDQCADNG